MAVRLIPRSLTLKLTLLYACFFSLAMALVFTTIYYVVKSELYRIVDEDLREDVVDIRQSYSRHGINGIERFARVEADDDGPENKFFIVLTRDGEPRFTTDLSWWGDILHEIKVYNQRRSPVFEDVKVPRQPGHEARVLIFRLEGHWIIVGVPMEWNNLILDRLRKAFWWGGAPAILFSILSGWFMARRTLSKVEKIDRVAKEIATGSDLSRRVPVSGSGDELDQLSSTFNAMLSRLESFVRELTEILDNTAHDFKTPLARIRTMAETTLSTKDMNVVKEVLVEIMNESDRFLSVLNAIMDISEARTGLLELRREEIAVNEILRELEGFFSGIARQRSIEFAVSYGDQSDVFIIDKARILQALLNIVDNAFKFTPPMGRVAIWYENRRDFVKIAISDTGPGIPEELIPRIFERFYRVDISRSSQGRGIGLALAKAFVESHKGWIRVESTPGKGSTFNVWLPRVPAVAFPRLKNGVYTP